MSKRPLSDAEVRRLSSAQRDLLITHIDGDVAVTIGHGTAARQALMRSGLLYPTVPGARRPRFTRLTERGRRAVGMILGDCADALVKAGLLEQANPLQVLQQLKAMRQTPWKGDSIVRKPSSPANITF